MKAVWLMTKRPPRAAKPVRDDEKRTRFDQAILPHLDAAYNLARWLLHSGHDAEDVVQEACLRAFRSLDGFHGTDGRAWLLAIVRNTCYTWLERQRAARPATTFDEGVHCGSAPAESPESRLARREDRDLLRAALEELPPEYREAIVLRELEGLSYKDIAGVAGVPLGTVMSRLARARERLQQSLTARRNEESRREL
jgi:RNA polymerase sigma-70 factor (ECF subfamily)